MHAIGTVCAALLSAICVVRLGTFAWRLTAAKAPRALLVGLWTADAALFAVAASDAIDPAVERLNGWTNLSASLALVLFVISSCATTLYFLHRAEPKARLRTFARILKIASIAVTVGVVLFMAWLYHTQLKHHSGLSAGYAHGDASVRFNIALAAGTALTHALLLAIGLYARKDPELRPIARLLITYAIAGFVFPAFMIAIRLDLDFLRWDDDITDLAVWAAQLISYEAISRAGMIMENQAPESPNKIPQPC